MPTCGRCKKPQVSATSIRACYNGQDDPHKGSTEPITPVRFAERVKRVEMSKADEEAAATRRLSSIMTKVPVGEKSDSPLWPASRKQIEYVAVLQEARRVPSDYRMRTQTEVERMERDDVSALITMLRSFPFRRNGETEDQTDSKWTMPRGNYALQVNGEVWFFQVDKPIKGKWAGYTFIKRLIGAPGSYRKLPMTKPERFKYLAKIEADPKAAAVLFGKESGTCFRCHSPLTVKESLARGMGPHCASKVGW